MSDIEDELLALAGGDMSSDDGNEDMELSRGDSGSPPPPPTKKREAASKGASVKKTPAKRGKKRGKADDSEEEGEASSVPSSPSSQQSVPMDESDSETEAPPAKARTSGADDDLNKYPVDGLFISHAEKAEIMSMPELEREIKIAERREEVERMRQNRLLRHMMVSQADTSQKKKRKAGAADLGGDDEDGDEVDTRKPSRARAKTAAGIDSLRRAREERSNRMHQRELERDRRGNRSPSYGRRSASRDGDGDSDVEWAKTKGRSRSPEKEILPPELRDVERVRVGREHFSQVAFYPGLEEALTGCFVRISIGPDAASGQQIYRMAVIKAFVPGRPYAMPNQRGSQMVVDTYVKIAHGKAQREYPFIACSNSPFTEAEWNRYKTICAGESIAAPTKAGLVARAEAINRLIQRPWTADEIETKVQRQNALKVRFSGLERERLQRLLDEARSAGNDAKAAQLSADLEKIDAEPPPRLAFKTSLATGGSAGDGGANGAAASTPTQQERLAVLNRENRRRNAEEVRAAQLKERARAREIEAALERGEAVAEDHSRRLKTKAKFLHDANGPASDTRRGGRSANGSGASTPAGGTPVLKAQRGAVLPHLMKLQQQQQQQQQGKGKGVAVIHKPLMDDDIIGALDLDVDVEI